MAGTADAYFGPRIDRASFAQLWMLAIVSSLSGWSLSGSALIFSIGKHSFAEQPSSPAGSHLVSCDYPETCHGRNPPGAEVFSVNLQLRLEHGTSRSREGFGLGLLPKRYRIYQAGVSVKMGLEHELCDGCSA